MDNVAFYVVNAFTASPFKGNPAGVVLNADMLDEDTMQHIARELKCSETAFVMESERADIRLRYFSPKKEVELCGHATIATFHTLAEVGFIRKKELLMETAAGILEIEILGRSVFMEQARPVFRDVDVEKKEVAEALGIEEHELGDLPVEAVSTGLFSLNIHVKTLETVQKMTPDFERVKELCKKTGVGALFIFTFETVCEDCLVHSRCFAPLYGVNEDPVTGTANGALGAYLKKHGLLHHPQYRAEQGFEMGRDGIIIVEAGERIRVGGEARIVMRGRISYPLR